MTPFGSLIGRLFDSNEKQVKKLQSVVDQINALEQDYLPLTDAQLKDCTETFRSQLTDGSTLDDILPHAFAAVREVAHRTISMRHFDVQLMGGITMHRGQIAEMRTGEGKTLVATLPLYLNALSGRGSHLVTVNDYLSKRDCLWMGPVYHALGLSVACISGRQDDDNNRPSFIYEPEYEDPSGHWSGLRPASRAEAYSADITYGTNNEFGFDYLRDNMVKDLSQRVQRELHYAIVDEVDNILIDEARTPLIISAPSQEAASRYVVFDKIISRLSRETDYVIDDRTRSVHLTDDVGIPKVEQMLHEQGLLKGPSMFDSSNYSMTHFLQSSLRAHALFRRDKDYVVKNGQVIIVDEFTGRLMPGRRYSEGLHQALEAKEHVPIKAESVTHATVTFQNYFRMYEKLAGMTGTAATEAEEFSRIYSLEVTEVPTNRPMVRDDLADLIYKDEQAKFKAVANAVAEVHETGRPVLVGTTSIEISEVVSDMLTRKGIRPQVLNAKNHEREAAIIAEAGRLNAVTVATNMAGRGVDILLGGSPSGKDADSWQKEHDKVIEMGGLYVVGTEHHEARRIDNQLRGRAGRQGDPGTTRFFVSLDDDIMRRFGGDRVRSVMQWAGIDEDTPIEHGVVTKAIANAQIQTEGYHFDVRKHLVEYDDVLNRHREVIYSERRRVLAEPDLSSSIHDMLDENMEHIVDVHVNPNMEEVEADGLINDLGSFMPLTEEEAAELKAELPRDGLREELLARTTRLARAKYAAKEEEIGSETMRKVERLVTLGVIDRLWMEHLTAMEHMRHGIGLRAAAQQQPLVVYKKEGHALFEGLLAGIKHDVASGMLRVSVQAKQVQPAVSAPVRPRAPVVSGKRVGRNDPCPCGSGKKYKHCCGK